MQITRFLRNKRVTPAEMFASAATRTTGLVAGRDVVVIQDTTSLRDDGNKRSLQLHPAIVVDAADGCLLGLLDAMFLRRDGRAKKIHCNNRLLAEKESRRWVEVAQRAALLRDAGAASVTVLADSEADIYEQFACLPAGIEVLVRSTHDRLLTDGRKLHACTEGLAELGRETIDLPAAPGRPARTAVVGLRACRVEIRRPDRNRARETASLPAGAALSLVEAREIDPPAGTKPLHWRLLTTHPVPDLAAARGITRRYRGRWTIEQLFRVMKTKGFDVEAVRIEETEPFEKLAAAILIAAIQVQQLVHDRDGTAKRPLEDVLDPEHRPALEAVCKTLEGKTQRQKNPHPPTSLAYVSWVCGRLGGWTGYYGKPGPIVTLNGLLHLQRLIQGFNLGKNL